MRQIRKWVGARHQQDNFIPQEIVDAVPLRIMYVPQTLFELLLVS